MAEEYELTDDQVEDSLEEQGFSPVWDSERWNEVLEDEFKGEVADDSVDDGPTADEVAPQAAVEAADTFRGGAENSDFVDIAGTLVPANEAERVARFWDWMNANPDQAMNFVGYMVGDYDLVPKGGVAAPESYTQPYVTPSAPIDEDDWDLLPESVQTQLKKVSELEQTLNYQQNAIAYQQQLESDRSHEQSLSHVEVAKRQFAKQYDVDQPTLANTVETAARLGVVPALMSESADPIQAVYRALEISYLQSENGRERELNRRIADTQGTKKRQRKMAAVGGTGGNVPRTAENLPNTKEGRRDAMVNEIAAAIRGG
tara:strand:- start:1254 stop:2201 length:948 start_codon:yes stop_codon:yes gene_type:complete